MKLSRRQLLAGVSALAIAPAAKAWFPHGTYMAKGWNTLPLGAGGLVTGFHIANDNSIVCRTDVGNIYRWTGTTSTTTNSSDQWVPLLTLASLAGLSSNPITNFSWGAIELVQAPSDATKIWAIFPPLANGIISPVYYSTDSAATWQASNITIQNTGPNTPTGYSKTACYRLAVDPVNSSVVYAGGPVSNGNTDAVYFASDGHTFSGIAALGQTTLGSGACGIVFDKSSGTVTVGGQTRTARIIIPIGGVDIYESVDGGQNWTSTGAASAFGTASFQVISADINSGGVYYAIVPNNGLWRYSGAAGTWTNIQPYAVADTDLLVVDPADPTYLTVTGAHGLRAGFTSTNANIGTPTWAGSGSAPYGNVVVVAPSYDLPYMTSIFGQGSSAFFFTTQIKIDSNGDTIMSGNQSIFKLSGRLTYTAGAGSTQTVTSFGRGQEATVAQEAWRPSGGTYPLLGPQDISLMLGGTFIKYPTGQFPGSREDVCSAIDESPTDGTFVVARVTSQGGTFSATDSSGYSTDAGVTFTPYATFPTLLWSANITASITSGVLTVTAVSSGPLFIGQEVYVGSSAKGFISSLGTGTGGTGTYNLTGGVDSASTSMFCQAYNAGGQIIAADNDHHLIVPAGFTHGTIPVVTADRGATWALCSGLPSANWIFSAWTNGGSNSKPIAVGFGADVGTVWVAAKTAATTLTIYKSTDFGATFSSVGTIAVSSNTESGYLLAVPGHTGHLWWTGSLAGGLWQSTDSGANWTSKNLPSVSVAGFNSPAYMSIGAIDPVSGTYPTLWMRARNGGNPSQVSALFYSIDGATSWTALGSHGLSGIKPDLPIRQQMYGLSSVRADRQIFKRLYCGCGQTGFAYYNP